MIERMKSGDTCKECVPYRRGILFEINNRRLNNFG